jgi:hypothetical protein
LEETEFRIQKSGARSREVSVCQKIEKNKTETRSARSDFSQLLLDRSGIEHERVASKGMLFGSLVH